MISLAQHQAGATVKKTNKHLFFGDKIIDLESDFWESGCVSVLGSLIRILRASLVQINTEMAEKYSNQRYAVNWHGRYAVILSESRFLPTPPAFDATVRGFPSEYRHPVWYGKTRMAWLPDGEKKFEDIYSFWHDPRT